MAANAVDKLDEARDMTRYTSNKLLRMSYIKNGDSNIKFVWSQAVLDVQIWIVGVIIGLSIVKTG